MTTPSEPTPAEVRALGDQAGALADRITALYEKLGAVADPEVRRIRFRLADASGYVHGAATDLEETARDLVRVRTARDPRLCGVPWGVCPEHGNTLRSSAGETWCMVERCGRRWTYDRLGLPCTEPITHRVTDTAGAGFDACNGHALDAEQRLEGGTVTRIAPISG
ncbi:hypothetical protein [Actinacidiphila acididurans]|uniref:Uncharacterized protein n=1 Tax=Actinacidiphila acididurans TaxID=2784346 RepID=A0ABS2U467_9ACTN|nr:hypothetical protein [Actinacidiphila acididurans]MBM9509941.1 hypothetical protein [Actinacidiphila acididurans]